MITVFWLRHHDGRVAQVAATDVVHALIALGWNSSETEVISPGSPVHGVVLSRLYSGADAPPGETI